MHVEAAEHAARRGDYPGALRLFSKAREFCADAYQTVTISLKLLEWAVVARDWNMVGRNVDEPAMKIMSDALKDAPL